MDQQYKRSTFRCLLAILLLSSFVSSGSLDPTFGTGGKFTTSFPDSTGGYRSSGFRIFHQSAQRIVAAGTFTNMGPDGQATGVVIIGLTGGGAPDGTFGPSAGMITDWDQVSHIGLSDAIVFSDGKFLRLSQHFPIFGQPAAKVIRYTVDGINDPSFSADINLVPNSNTIPLKASILPSGKVMVLASAQTNPESHHLFRLNPDGSRDTTFGINGDKLMNFNRLPNVRFNIVGMHTLPNGKTVIAGNLGTPQQFQNYDQFFIARFDTDGNLDWSFGRFGIVRYSFGVGLKGFVTDLIIDPVVGRYTLVGAIKNPDQDVFMIRFGRRGKPDGTFGTRGVVVSDITPGGTDYLSSITTQPDGKLIVAGQASPTPGAPVNFLLARYSDSGVLEAHTKTEFTPGQFASALDVTVQPDGKILAIGSTYNPSTPSLVASSMFAIARYTDITNDPPIPAK